MLLSFLVENYKKRPQDGTKNDSRSAQDDSKTIFKSFFFRLRFCHRFWSVLGAILAPSWPPFGRPNGPGRSNLLAQKRYETIHDGPRRPKTDPRRPQDLARPPQDAPRGAQDRPRPPQRPPQTTKNRPKTPTKRAKFDPRLKRQKTTTRHTTHNTQHITQRNTTQHNTTHNTQHTTHNATHNTTLQH